MYEILHKAGHKTGVGSEGIVFKQGSLCVPTNGARDINMKVAL